MRIYKRPPAKDGVTVQLSPPQRMGDGAQSYGATIPPAGNMLQATVGVRLMPSCLTFSLHNLSRIDDDRLIPECIGRHSGSATML